MPDVVHITTVHDRRDPRIFERQLQTLGSNGYTVCLIAQGDERGVESGVEIVPIGRSRGRARRLRLMGPAYKAATEAKPRLIHIHDPELIVLARALKRSTGARIVYDIHENYGARGGIGGRAIRGLEKWIAAWADAIVVVEDNLAAMVRGWGRDAVVIRNYFKPIEPQAALRDDATGPDGKTTLVYTGVIDRVRGLETLVATSRIIDAGGVGARVRVVGVCYVGEERRLAEADFRRSGMPPSLSLEGWADYVGHGSILQACAEAHIGLALWQPHRNHSTIPTKFYEYLYYGLPIICSDLPHWSEFIDANDCGTTVPVGDAEAVVAALNRYRDDPSRYRRQSEAALRVGSTRTWASEEGKLLELYSGLIGPPR